MKRHRLYEVNLEQKTAFCTVCGYTEIYIPPTRTRVKPKAFCINRAREIWLENEARNKAAREDRRQRPGWKPRHTLTEIDPETMRAVCVICGPTDIRKISSGGFTRYECLTMRRNYMRAYNRPRYVARSTNPHALSQIDEENRTAVCATCGPVEIDVWQTRKKINRRCINAKRTRTE
jgi:hypothetical protein